MKRERKKRKAHALVKEHGPLKYTVISLNLRCFSTLGSVGVVVLGRAVEDRSSCLEGISRARDTGGGLIWITLRRRNSLRSFDAAPERSIARCVYQDRWMTSKPVSSMELIVELGLQPDEPDRKSSSAPPTAQRHVPRLDQRGRACTWRSRPSAPNEVF